MAENSKIEWCDHTFNPFLGCTKVSPACDNCYAQEQTARFKMVEWGPHAVRKRTSDQYWKQPLSWNRKAEKLGIRPRVFCGSLCDVADNHKSIEQAWRDDLWQVIRNTPNLDWLLVTKRPQNLLKFVPVDWYDGYENVWLGTTVENQTEADRRIPELLKVPAKVHFLSCEPLLGDLNLTNVADNGANDTRLSHLDYLKGHRVWGGHINSTFKSVDWVICGGESGRNARPMHPDWARSLRDQCKDANVPFFFKQWGEWSPTGGLYDEDNDDPQGDICMDDDGYVWDMNIQPSVRGKPWLFERTGKKRAGRLLDGVTHDNYPEVNHA